MKTSKIVFFIFCFGFCFFTASAQITAGQFLINGEGSFFNSHATDTRSGSERTINGAFIPAYEYDFQQYAHNLTLSPRAHYFLSEKWSLGFSFTFRHLISHRFITSFELVAPTDFVQFNTSSKAKGITYLYAPVLEVTRHWNISKRFAINLTGTASWQWVKTRTETVAALEFIEVSELSNWTVSNNGMTFSPQDLPEETTKAKEQYWSIGVFPQLRYAISPRFGLTAAIGGINLSQKYEDDTPPGFVRAKPDWSVRLNPDTWSFGLFMVLGKAATEVD